VCVCAFETSPTEDYETEKPSIKLKQMCVCVCWNSQQVF